jgi:LacI family transcriptional regulator
MHPFFADIAKAISSETRKHGYSLFISSSDADPELEVHEIKQPLARRGDVIMVASAKGSVGMPNRFRALARLLTESDAVDPTHCA